MAAKKEIKANSNGLAGNIDLGFSTEKKRFSVGGDVNNVIELDTSDLGVANRLSKSLSTFKELEDKWKALNESADKVSNSDDVDAAIISAEEFSKQFDEIEKQMRVCDQIHNECGIRADIQRTVDLNNQSRPGHYKPEQICAEQPQKAEQQIRDRACQGGNCHAMLGVFEMAGIDRYGTCPAEAEHHHHNRTERIQMLQRIERQTSHVARRRITHLIRGIPVSGLMHRQRQQNDRNPKQKHRNIGK